MQVGTSGAGGTAEAPGLERTTPSSVAMQNRRTPLELNDKGAELATKDVFVGPPAAMNPAAKNLYPLLLPALTTLSRMQAWAGAGEHPAGPPRLARSGEKPTAGNVVL